MFVQFLSFRCYIFRHVLENTLHVQKIMRSQEQFNTASTEAEKKNQRKSGM